MKKKIIIPVISAMTFMATYTVSNQSNDSTSLFFVESDNIALAEVTPYKCIPGAGYCNGMWYYINIYR